MISEKDFLMGRDKEFPLTPEMKKNMKILLERVNKLSLECFISFKVNSGYRPGKYNTAAGGAPNSAHTTCEAVDLGDTTGMIGKWLTDAILLKYELYREAPEATKGWCHLTTRAPKSGNRTFKP